MMVPFWHLPGWTKETITNVSTVGILAKTKPFGAGIIFLILAHSVYKMWIIQEPNKLALWNKLHFEEKKTETVEHV